MIEILQTRIGAPASPGTARRATSAASVPSVLGQQFVRTNQQNDSQRHYSYSVHAHPFTTIQIIFYFMK
jgi:hypothetical protein